MSGDEVTASSADLYQLAEQLQIIVGVLMVAAEQPETSRMLATVDGTVTRLADWFSAADPSILSAVRDGVANAAHGRPGVACSDLIRARRALLALLRPEQPARPLTPDDARWLS